MAVASLWQCPLDWTIRALLISITAIGALIIFLPTRLPATLTVHHDNSWNLISPTSQCSGQLALGSYRSALLVVIAIRPEQGRVRHAIVWRDTVSAHDFSFLHIRLALTSSEQLK